MHVPGSRLGEYRTRWTFYGLSPHELSGGFIKIKEKKNWVESAESYRCVFNTFLPYFDMHIYRFSPDKVHILKFRTLAFFHKRNF